MEDLTCIYLTASIIPDSFAEYQRSVLREAIGETQIISISRKPLKFGTNLLDDGEKSQSNIYRQLLRGAKIATTPFVAVAEDDTFYPKEHFTFYRPQLDTFAYNQNRWALFTWNPIYSWRNRKSNATLIAPRELLIEALEERFAKWPQGTPDDITGEVGRYIVEKNLKLKPRKSVEMFSEVSVVQINHEYGSEKRQKTHRKSLGQMKAYSLHHWGEAKHFLDRL